MTSSSGRYARQSGFAALGEDGQARIERAKCVIVGCGGLGSFLAEMIVRAGVAETLLVDSDRVELSNLQRQVLYLERDALKGTFKAEAAARRLRETNSEVRVVGLVERVDAANVEGLLRGADLVLDAVDNVETRFLVNDACVRLGIPFVYGSVVADRGLVMPVIPGEGPCLRCVFEEAPTPGAVPTCRDVGVLAPAVAAVAAFQAAEALKILAGRKEALVRAMRSIELWNGTVRLIPVGGFGGAAACRVCRECGG